MMSGEQNTVSKGSDSAINSAKSDTEAKTNIKRVAAFAEDTVVEREEDIGGAQSADAEDPGAGANSQQNKS